MGFYYDLTSKTVFKMFPASEIIKYYNIGHTFDPGDAVERFMEAKGYSFDYTRRGLNFLKDIDFYIN